MNGIKKFKLIALDSNAFIYHFESNPQFVKKTQLIFEALSKDKLKAVTSVISIIETLSYPTPKEVIKQIKEGFLSVPNLTVYDVTQSIGLEAARIRREYGFRLPDSIQLATALLTKSQAFITNDQRISVFKELEVVLLTTLPLPS